MYNLGFAALPLVTARDSISRPRWTHVTIMQQLERMDVWGEEKDGKKHLD